MLIERFFEQVTGRRACGESGAKLLGSTAHLVKARSTAVAAAQCVFLARLGETMGIRGFYHSVLPGKGQAVHLVLALAFPRLFREHVGGGSADYRGVVEEVFEWLKDEGIVESDKLTQSREDAVVDTAKELARAGIEFVEKAFEAMLGSEASEALARSRVLVEQQFMSYNLHVWGVADVVIEDPVERRAAIIEWKSYSPSESRAPQVSDVDVAQAYVYALLEAERLGLAGKDFESYVKAVLGRPPHGADARVIPGVVRPSPSGRASRLIVRHPRLCVGVQSRQRCSYEYWEEMLAKLVVAAEHLTLSVTDLRSRLEDARVVEEICSVASRSGKRRPVFRLTPDYRRGLVLDGKTIALPIGYPLREELKWPCIACNENVREACVYYLRSGNDPSYADFRAFRNEAWRARFANYRYRENALAPYRYFRELALKFGSDFSWLRGKLQTRILPDGSRIDLFDKAWVEGDELVLERPPLRWEKENLHLFTLREGKPVAVFLNEPLVRDPLLRVSFHGSVSSVKLVRDDADNERVVVRVAPVNKLSRIYPRLLEYIEKVDPDAFTNVVAAEVNVELTQLELLGIAAAEIGTVEKGVRALEKLRSEEELEAEELLALLFSGVKI